MARISEFEQSNYDSIEIAITAEEYANLGTEPGQLKLQVGAFTSSGADYGRPVAASTDQASWTLDTDTGEYVLTLTNVYYNHNANYQGIALASIDSSGNAIEVYDAYMVGTFGAANFNFSTTSDTVTSSSWLPVGTEFTDISQGNPTNPSGGDNQATVRWDAPDIDTPKIQQDSGLNDTGTAPPVCFARGTKLLVEGGRECFVEDLQKGDLVLTRDNGLQPIRWIGSRQLSAAELEASPKLRPICIRAGALMVNTPKTNLEVSPQHRILVRSNIAQRMFGTDEVLVGAKHLLEIDGVDIVEDAKDVEYFHILFDQHEIVFSNGAETESLYTGLQALKSLDAIARAEVLALFPELEKADSTVNRVPARPLITSRRGKQLAMRHKKHGRRLLS